MLIHGEQGGGVGRTLVFFDRKFQQLGLRGLWKEEDLNATGQKTSHKSSLLPSSPASGHQGSRGPREDWPHPQRRAPQRPGSDLWLLR